VRWRISFFLLICFSAQAAYVVNNAGRQISGREISADSDGRVTLKTSNGQVMTFQKGQYRSAVADRPKELDIAEKRLREGRGSEAVPFLKQAKKKCRFLKWDQEAIQLLADYYFESGQFALAIVEFQSLDDQAIPQNQVRVREAMMKSGEVRDVMRVLDEDIRSGSREAAAKAYVLRGQLKVEQGDVEGARRDWFKVVTFFKAQSEVVVEAENLLKENEV